MTDESKRFHRSFVIVMVSDFLKNKETRKGSISIWLSGLTRLFVRYGFSGGFFEEQGNTRGQYFYMAERVDAVIRKIRRKNAAR